MTILDQLANAAQKQRVIYLAFQNLEEQVSGLRHDEQMGLLNLIANVAEQIDDAAGRLRGGEV